LALDCLACEHLDLRDDRGFLAGVEGLRVVEPT
jgi:hypothetical protein